jgi:hypothetical protein
MMEGSDIAVLLVVVGLGAVAVYFFTRPTPAPVPIQQPCSVGFAGVVASCGAIQKGFQAITNPVNIDKVGAKVGSAGKTVADVGVRSGAAFVTGGLSETKTGRKIVGQVESVGNKILSYL